MFNQALHTLLHYQEFAVDLSRLGMQSCVFYNYSNGVRTTEYAQSNTAFEEAFQGERCCCQIRLYTLYYITKSLLWI